MVIIIEGKVKARAGSAGKGANRITLLRDTNGDGVRDLRTPFIEHLNSPFSVVLVDDMLYLANTHSLVGYRYTTAPRAFAFATI